MVGITRPCRVRTPLTKHLNRAMMVAVAATLDRDHGGGGTGSRDRSIAVNGSLSRIYAT